MDFPKDRAENLAWRTSMLMRCKEDMEYRLQMKELFHRNILFAFNAFFYTYDTRKRPKHHIPFATWDYQDETILEIQKAVREGYDLVGEKSRDMGFTWMVLLVFLHEWLNPVGGADFLLGSRIEDYVDKRGDMRTLFEKLRYAFYRLPRWLWPEGFNQRKHDNYMKLLNPQTGAVIGGESNNPNYATGGRYAAVLFDEFAKWEATDESAWTSAGDASKCRLAVSTPFGAAGQYYKLVTDGKTKRLRLHWSIHPEKSIGLSAIWPPPNEEDKTRLLEHWKPDEKLTSPWYEKECERRDPKEIAQELDIDYVGAGAPVFDGKSGASLRFYHKTPDIPLCWLSFDLEGLKYNEISEPRDWENHLVVYERVNPIHRYTIGVDVVEGKEDGDFATVVVLDRMTKNIAANYYSKIDEVMLSRVVKITSDYYTPKEKIYYPWVGVETTGPGLATFDFCVLLEVTNLFMAPRYDVTNGTVSFKKGWRTDVYSRNELIAGVRQYLIDRAGNINSQRIVGELLNFVRSKTGKAQAKSGAHDDEVFGLGIALQVDEIAPSDYEEVRRARPEYNHEAFFTDMRKATEEDTSVDGRCIATVIAKKKLEEHQEQIFFGEIYADY